MPPAFLVAVTAGFFLHIGWSFKGHGARDKSGRQHGKFLLVQGFGLVLNALFTWIITGPLFHGPAWLPLIPIVTITPLATFALNRQWVFGLRWTVSSTTAWRSMTRRIGGTPRAATSCTITSRATPICRRTRASWRSAAAPGTICRC